jgi:uncharacterized phage-associated protein
VIYDLYYKKYKGYKWHPIDEEVSEADSIDDEYLRHMVSPYIRYSKAALTTITHRERPCLEARGDLDESEGSNTLITKECLRNYFRMSA